MKKAFLLAMMGAVVLCLAFITFSKVSADIPEHCKGKGSVDIDDDCGKYYENDDDDDDDDDDKEGDLRIKIKIYDKNGNPTGEKIVRSKVKLYKKNGKKVDEDKTNFKGEANFYDLDEGKYYFKCEVPGTVNLKKPHKDYYKGSEKVEDDERSKDTCHLQRV